MFVLTNKYMMHNLQIKSFKNSLVVDVIGEIGESFFLDNENTFDRVKKQIEASEFEDIVLNINSLGGDAFEAFAIYDILTVQNKPIQANIFGATASAGTIIAMAADTVNINQNAFFLIHNSWMHTIGNAEELREQAEQLDKIDARMVAIYKKKTGMEEEEIRELMEKEIWIDAEEAISCKFADNITVPLLAAASMDKTINKINSIDYLPKINTKMAENKKDEKPLQNQLAELKAENESFAAKVQSLETRNELLEKQLKESAEKNAQLEVKASAGDERTEQYYSLKGKFEALQKEVDSKKAIIKSQETTIATYQAELTSSTERHSKLVAELHRLQSGKGFNSNGDFVGMGNELDNEKAARAKHIKSAFNF